MECSIVLHCTRERTLIYVAIVGKLSWDMLYVIGTYEDNKLNVYIVLLYGI